MDLDNLKSSSMEKTQANQSDTADACTLGANTIKTDNESTNEEVGSGQSPSKKPMLIPPRRRSNSIEIYETKDGSERIGTIENDAQPIETEWKHVARMSTSKLFRGYSTGMHAFPFDPLPQSVPPVSLEEDSQTPAGDTETIETTSETSGYQSDPEVTILTQKDPPQPTEGRTEVIDYIEIFEDDDLDANYKDVPLSKMRCEVCERNFKNRHTFSLHHRRHLAQEHYQCPTCLLGFTSLRQCTNHEIRAHKKKPLCLRLMEGEGNNYEVFRASSPSITSSSSTVSTTNYDEDEEEDDNVFSSGDTSKRVLVSNSLLPYRGPPVPHMTECFSLELKHQPKNRGASSSVSHQIQHLRERYCIIGDRLGPRLHNHSPR